MEGCESRILSFFPCCVPSTRDSVWPTAGSLYIFIERGRESPSCICCHWLLWATLPTPFISVCLVTWEVWNVKRLLSFKFNGTIAGSHVRAFLFWASKASKVELSHGERGKVVRGILGVPVRETSLLPPWFLHLCNMAVEDTALWISYSVKAHMASCRITFRPLQVAQVVGSQTLLPFYMVNSFWMMGFRIRLLSAIAYYFLCNLSLLPRSNIVQEIMMVYTVFTEFISRTSLKKHQ